ncbi:MAG: hypothetical protein RSD97_08180 [Lachnospiraceae bacterium]
MGQNKFKWDLDGLNASLEQLKKEKENLEANRQFLKTLKSEVMQNWQGATGTVYLASLNVDMENFEIILKGLEKKIEILHKISTQIYRECEEQVNKKVDKMTVQIRKI